MLVSSSVATVGLQLLSPESRCRTMMSPTATGKDVGKV